MPLQGNLQYREFVYQMYFVFYSSAYRLADVSALITEFWKSMNCRGISKIAFVVGEIAHG